MRSPRLLLAALLTGTMVLAACGEDPTAGPSETEGAAAQTWPLTGLPVRGGGDAARARPVLVLKMDNTPSSSPQVGLGSADLIVEELVEGGVTRLAAFYYTDIPGEVGPIRSMRASDIGIVAPVDGSMVTSGAAGVTIARVKEAGIDYFSDGSAGFFRDSGRAAPYNLFTDLGAVADAAKQKAARPDDYLPWGEADQAMEGERATSLTARFSDRHSTTWQYRKGGYVSEGGYAAAGDEFPADTVLVLAVQVGDAGYLDPAGNTVPETKLTGKGGALLFHEGRVRAATWSKKGLDAPLSLRTDEGGLSVPPGHTWIELVPQSSGGVTYGR